MLTKQNVDNAAFRQLMGERATSLTDDELDDIRRSMYALAENLIERIQRTEDRVFMDDAEGKKHLVLPELLAEDSDLDEFQFEEIDPFFPTEPDWFELYCDYVAPGDVSTGPVLQDTINKLVMKAVEGVKQ